MCRGAGEDSVEVFRIPLRFHEGFTSTFGTAVEIGIAGSLLVEGVDDLLRLEVCFMNRAITEILNLFRAVHGPSRVGSFAFVAIVGAGRRESLFQFAAKRVDIDRSRQSAISHLLEFLIPALRWHP